MTVINFQGKQSDEWKDALEELKAEKITHAVIAYRKDNGDLCYRLYGSEHVTFLIGMLDRIKCELHLDDRNLDE